MQKRFRRAFTLVELVIVIAVVAILAAVLIPTFGGVINKSNLSVDTQTAANINKNIALETVNKEITSLSIIEEAIIATYGQEFFDNLAPKTYDQGYNYWFNTETKLVEVKKYDEVLGGAEPVRLSNNTKTFSENNFRQFGNYYLLDQVGADFTKVIKGFENPSNDSFKSVITMLQNILSDNKNHHYGLAEILKEKVQKTAIISNAGTFRWSNLSEVTKVIFTDEIELINSNLYIYDESSNTVSKQTPSTTYPIANVTEITLPSTVKTVSSNSLYFQTDNTVRVYGSFKTVEDAAAIFAISSTNGIIMIDGDEYKVVDDELQTLEGVWKADLGYTNPVASFDIVYTESSKVKKINNVLYVAYDLKEFILKADNFVGRYPSEEVSLKDVSWSSSNTDFLTIDQEGKVKIEKLPEWSENNLTFEISATAVNGNVTKTITVAIVRITSASLIINDTDVFGDVYGQESPFEIDYTGENSEFQMELSISDGHNPTTGIELNGELMLETTGDLFEITSNNVLKLKKFSGTQQLTIKVGEYLTKTITIKVNNLASATFETKFEYSNTYLYRVGNENTITLGTLFQVSNGKKVNTSDFINIAIKDMSKTGQGPINTNGTGFSATYEGSISGESWENVTIKFIGSGIAKIIMQIQGETIPCELVLEVINGKNIINGNSISGSTNSAYILLEDINYNSAITIGNGKLYGNGFAINAPTYKGSGNYFISLTNGIVDNVIINGPVYPEVVYERSTGYYNSGIYVNGNAKITNSYISGFRQPIWTDSSLTIENTTLYGGVYGNLVIAAGNVTLRDVTTIQEVVTSTFDNKPSVMGAGIILSTSAVTANSSLIIEGKFNQYNWTSKNDVQYMDDDCQTPLNVIFSKSDADNFKHNIDGTYYLNAGIIFMGDRGNDIYGPTGKNNSTNNKGFTYGMYKYTTLGATGCVGTYVNNVSISKSDIIIPNYVPNKQAVYEPKFTFTQGKNIILKLSGSSCVFNAMDGVSAAKYTNTIYTPYEISSTAGTISGNNITFTEAGVYTVTYAIEDNEIYNKDGKNTSETLNYFDSITVEVQNPDIPDAVVSHSGEIPKWNWELSGLNDYIIYFSILDGVTIKDYDEDRQSLEEKTIDLNVMPEGLTLSIISVKGKSPVTEFINDNGNLNIKTINDMLCLYDKKADNEKNDGYTFVIQYAYTGVSGKTVYSDKITLKFVTGSETDSSSSSSSTCITPDTLITLANGTQVQVKDLTGEEELLVWNLETGSFDKAPIMFVDSEEETVFEVINLYFSDGTKVGVISEHGFWDYDLNKYVYLDSNASKYIGHTFAKQDGNVLSKVQLVDVIIEEKLTTAWSPVTVGHLCYFVNGMLSMPGGVGGLFNIFDVDSDTMMYDYESIAIDIETYGLFTYEELNSIIPLSEEMFDAAGGQYLKISIGKGNMTMDELIYMIDRYSNYFE